MNDEQKNPRNDESGRPMEDELERQINEVRKRFYETTIPNHSMSGLSHKYYISDYSQKSTPNPSTESELDYFLDELESATDKLESCFSKLTTVSTEYISEVSDSTLVRPPNSPLTSTIAAVIKRLDFLCEKLEKTVL